MQQALSRGASDRGEAHRAVQAEIVTAAALARLGPGWQVLHSLPVGPGPATLAHLVIGPGGVFAVSSRPRGSGGTSGLDSTGPEDLAEVRQLAQRVRAALGQRLGPADDPPTVHPLLCLLDDDRVVRGSTEHVAVWRVSGRLQDHQERLPAAAVQRLATAAADPATWGAPVSEWHRPDLSDRYDAVRSGVEPAGRTGPRVQDDRAGLGQGATSQPPQVHTATWGLRSLAVLTVLLGMTSLGSGGMTSLMTLVIGALTLRHHGGWWRCNPEDASLIVVGMGMATLSLLLLPGVLLLLAAP